MKPRADGRYTKTKRVDGKKIFGYGQTLEEAEADLGAKLQAFIPSIDEIPENETLHQFAKRVWYPSLEFDVAPLTKSRYTSSYVTHVRPRLGAIPIRDLKKPVVQEFVYQMLRDGVGAASIRFALERVSSIAGLALDHELIGANPCRKLRAVPKKPEKRERAMTLEQAGAVLDGVLGTDLSCPVFMALVLSCRLGECAGAKWEDLDRQKGELKVWRQRQAQSGKGIVTKAVKADSVRTLRLDRRLIEELDRRGNLDSEYICTRDGAPWVPQTIYEDWQLVRDRFGLGAWTFHDLRHGAAGLLYATGATLLEVAMVLGHSKPDMTLVYTGIPDEKKGESLRRLSESLVDRNSAGSQMVVRN